MLEDLKNLSHTGTGNFFLIAGPCVVEGESITQRIAEEVGSMCDRLKIPFIFKASYRKANRTRLDSFTGLGDDIALAILGKIGRNSGLPVLTDIHESTETEKVASYVDVLQIPAFLCRQTELLVSAAKTGKWINIKKGQFVSPGNMKFAIDKVIQSGNNHVMLTERGTMLGYGDIIVDFRGIPEMKQFNVPVVLDVTHSLQQPNQIAGVTGGKPELIETIASAGIATGVDGIFLETHPDPSSALSDGANMIPLGRLESLLKKLVRIREAVQR
jgi:2-dehydro-3-deoxyphosphooctonate aldolase (KDO 8-P synthase)